MTKRDIIEMYKKGFSINHIIHIFYKYKTKHDIPNHKFNNQFIVTKKSITLKDAEKYVKSIILEFALSNKAN